MFACRVGAHSLCGYQGGHVRKWLRVLKPGGRLCLVDTIAPEDAACCGSEPIGCSAILPMDGTKGKRMDPMTEEAGLEV